MKQEIRSMMRRYNNWKKRPLAVPVARSAQGVLKGIKSINDHSNACKASCGSECDIQTCVSCKAEA